MSFSLYNLPPKYAVPQLLYGTRRREYPMAWLPTHFTVEEKYLVKAGNYSRLENNTPNSVFPTAYLVDENIDREEGDGIWFTRLYSTIPSSWSAPQTFAGNYPGLYVYRAPFVESAPGLEQHDYFMVGAGTPYATEKDIPFIGVDRLTYSDGVFTNSVPLLSGGEYYLNDGGGVLFPTTPSRATYIGWIADDLAIDSFTLVAEASKPQRYKANIWDRVTLYVKAK